MENSGTCLDLVNIAYGVIELDRSPFGIHVCLLGSSTVQDLGCGWSRSMSVPRNRWMRCGGGVLRWWLSPLLNWTVTIKRRALARSLRHCTVTALGWCAELGLWALDAVKRSLPVCGTLRLLDKSLAGSRRRGWGRFHLNPGPRTDRVNGGARGSCHANAVGVVFKATLNPVPRRQECVESLNEIRMACEQL